MPANAVTLTRNQVADELTRVEEQAKDAYARWQTELDKVSGEGKNLALPENRDEFNRLDEIKKEHSTLAERALDLRNQALDVKEWELGDRPSSYAALNEAHGAMSEAAALSNAQRQIAKVMNIADRVMSSVEYKDLCKSRVLDSKEGRVQASLGKLMTKNEIKNVLRVGDSSTGGAFVIPADSGILAALPQRAPRLLDLITTGTTDEISLQFVKELTIPNSAAFVAEADSSDPTDTTGLKPESTATYEAEDATTKIVAHWVAMTKKSLRNQAFLRTLMETRLMQGLYLKAETSVLGGSGGDEFTGIKNTSGIGTFDYDTDAVTGDTMADAIHRQMTLVEISMEDTNGPLSVALNKLDWQKHALAKDANGNYINGKPSDPNAPKQIWGSPVITSSLFASGANVVGDYAAAIMLVAEDANVLVSDAPNNFFLKNMVALLCEFDAMFFIPQPLAFCAGSNLQHAA